ncbi:uncharacterized protein LOC120280289 isoform X2 [Dioscorea cayenensis subsp. rotundata]|uniref:Uncharacterized protein LOC120280289 isoform X2 n=1 Tax=Dioscorea cayennensis subsp. rotundata TaxID=55577 RepID=A0AB40CSK3_DIOCR|nr:uncharacterized protein LOC120280289 isoform X2 [Dioscorea cayenensis subsp. rotundata]
MNFLCRSLPLLCRSISSKIPSSPRPHLPLSPPLFSRSISNLNPTAGLIPNPSLSWRRFCNLDRLQPQQWHHNRRTILQPLAVLLGVIVGGGGVIYYRYFETVPFSNNSRLVIVSPLAERDISEIEFQKLKNGLEGRILPGNHPDTIRVRRISENIIEAIQPCLNHDKRQWGNLSYAFEIHDKWQWGDLWYACEIQALEQSPETTKKAAEAESWEVLVVSDKNFLCLFAFRVARLWFPPEFLIISGRMPRSPLCLGMRLPMLLLAMVRRLLQKACGWIFISCHVSVVLIMKK